VIVHNLDVFSAGRRPTKADAILIIHSNTVLTRTCSFQRLKAVARWDSQVIETARDLELTEFPASDRLDLFKSFDTTARGERCRVRVSEGQDHQIVTHGVINVKRD
jgi:hypothetical protein